MKRLLATILSLTLLSQTALANPQDDAALLKGLQQRGLFSLVEYQCQKQIDDPNNSERTKMEWTVHLISSIAQRALRQPIDQRSKFWQQAQEVSDDYVATHRDNPLIIPVKLQAALALTANGELLRLESTISKTAGAQRENSRQQLRLATRALMDLENEIKEFLPQVNQTATDDTLTQADLLSIQQNLQYHLARTYRNQANTYAAGTNDQIASLQRAVTSLKKPLTQLSNEDPLVAKIHLGLIACHRELNQFDEAQAAVSQIEKLPLPPEVLLKLRAENVRLVLAMGELETALKLLNTPRESQSTLVPEYDLAFLDAFIYFWGKATKEENADLSESYQQQAVLTVKHIEQTHGPYWGRVAELRLLRHAGMNGNSTNLVVLERTADDLYRKDKFSEAIEAYDATAEAARNAGNNDLAFRALYKAALIEQKRGNTEAYIARLITTAVQLRSHQQAPAVHMLGIRTVVELLNKDASRQEEFETLLTEHITYFEQGSTVNQAAIWLATLQQRRQNYDQAIANYMIILTNYPNYPDVISSLEACWAAKLKGQEQANLLTIASPFLEHLKSLIYDEAGDLPGQWTVTQRYAATALAGFQLTYSTEHYASAEMLLAAASQNADDATWLAIASSLRIVSLAAQGKSNAARQHIDALSNSTPDQWLQVLNQLQTVATGAPDDTRKTIAQMQIHLFTALTDRLTGVTADFKRKWSLIEAQAYIQSGNLTEGFTKYQQLAAKNPRHGLIQLRYAQALSQSEDHFEAGLIQWRRVLQGNPPKSDRWYEAKFRIAELYLKNGKREAAEKQVRYLEVTSGFGTWESEFTELLKRITP
ncbi:MAG: hypothetical protein CMJ79_03340 [Planctomycetaceae bacterium]|nr:hypothetical protein [Planctomycetaceae bacterium]